MGRAMVPLPVSNTVTVARRFREVERFHDPRTGEDLMVIEADWLSPWLPRMHPLYFTWEGLAEEARNAGVVRSGLPEPESKGRRETTFSLYAR